MWKKIILSLLAIVAVFLVYVALQSPHYEISRQITVQAPVEKVFPYLNSPRLSDQWAPWPELEPETRMVHSGPETGVGARTDWADGKELGTGSATIVESVPNERVAVRLEYVKPMQMVQNSEYLLQSNGAETTVTWKVTGENNFLGRLMCSFMNMDKIVGGLFERGLAKLKTVVETK